MKKSISFSILVLFFFVQCHKNDTNTTDPLPPDQKTEKPKKITLSFYRQNALLKKWIYEIDSMDLASLQGIIYWTDSSYNSFPGQSTFYKARQVYSYDPGAGLFSSIISRNYQSGRIEHWVNNQVALEESTMNNFVLSSPLTSIGPSGIHEHNFLLKLYSDTLQRRPPQTSQNTVDWYWFNNKKYVNIIYGSAGASNSFEIGRDSIYLREALTTFAINYTTEMRYYYYYTNEIPWYSRKKVDRSVFYSRSPYVCDSFVLRNGDYVFPSSTSDGIFTSSLERKVTYQYTSDTTAIKAFIDVVNPIIKEPLWFYITANAHSFTTFGVREGGNYNDLYNWMSSRSTDSVFLMTAGRRVFKQAAATANTVERDAKGRISKITNKTENSNSFKTIELSYK